MVGALAALDLVARVGTARGACNRRDRVTRAAADLMADKSTDNAANQGAGDVVRILFGDDFDAVDGADVGALRLVALVRVLLRRLLLIWLIRATGEAYGRGDTHCCKH